jgi:hypothetical protein
MTNRKLWIFLVLAVLAFSPSQATTPFFTRDYCGGYYIESLTLSPPPTNDAFDKPDPNSRRYPLYPFEGQDKYTFGAYFTIDGLQTDNDSQILTKIIEVGKNSESTSPQTGIFIKNSRFHFIINRVSVAGQNVEPNRVYFVFISSRGVVDTGLGVYKTWYGVMSKGGPQTPKIEDISEIEQGVPIGPTHELWISTIIPGHGVKFRPFDGKILRAFFRPNSVPQKWTAVDKNYIGYISAFAWEPKLYGMWFYDPANTQKKYQNLADDKQAQQLTYSGAALTPDGFKISQHETLENDLLHMEQDISVNVTGRS